MIKEQVRSVRFNFHPELCVGCGACVTACMDTHDTDLDCQEPLRRMFRREQIRQGQIRLTWYTAACLHCENAPCATVCKKGCFVRDAETNTMQLDNSDCVGCGQCEKVCSFLAIVFTKEKKAVKCDGCFELLQRGLLPACVKACPRFAVTIDDRPAVLEQSRRQLAKAFAVKSLKK